MGELAAQSGVARETIHFYLREGLLPKPRKGGRTVAFYGEEHLERLRIIRRLREEKYLPLAVIRRLLDSPGAAAERDVDALAEILHILPPASDHGAGGRAPSSAATEAAKARGLLGERAGNEAADRRVLAVVDDTLALDPAARALTLADLEACASGLTELVTREAGLFFDEVFRSGDVGASIAALRSGRSAVARFIAAYRDLMLRRIVEDLLLAVQQGPDAVARAATVELSTGCVALLGVHERRSALRAAVDRGEEGAADALVWHLFGSGAATELAALEEGPAPGAGPEARVLIAWGMHERARSAPTLAALERAALAAPAFGLGHILVAEAAFARALSRRRGGEGLVEEAVPALHRLVSADPAHDPDPLARAFGHFHRGRVELALPPVLGRRAAGAAALAEALAIVERHVATVEPAAVARITANARLALGRYAAALGDRERARVLLTAAAEVDPEGPTAEAARAEMDLEMLSPHQAQS